MTCIVALQTDTGVYLGTDSAFGDESETDLLDRPKFTVHSRHVIATSGALRAGQIAEAVKITKKQRSNENDLDFLLRALAGPIRDAIKDDGSKPSFGTLIIYKGQIYALTDDFGIIRSVYKYDAIGSGAPLARGFLAGSEGLELEPADRVERALKASARHDPNVRKPFTIRCFP